MLFFVSLISLCTPAKPPFQTSRFGKEAIDEVGLDFVDGFEVLERGLKKPVTRPISQAGFTKYIDPNDYPWPNHNFNGTWTIITDGVETVQGTPGTCDWAKLKEETNAIRNRYNRSNIKASELYKHPAAMKQYYATDEEIDKADRVKVRFVLTTHINRHYVPVFIPPGEIAEIDILPEAVGKLFVTYNRYISGIWTLPDGNPKFKSRLDNMRMDKIPLNYTHNTIGLPYGIYLNFEGIYYQPIEVNITNCVLCPYFKYGVHSDDEWENDLSKRPGPVAVFETGNIVISTPASLVRNTFRINDNMKYYRSAYQISQTTARDGHNDYDDRVKQILELNVEQFVPAGAAVAFVGRNFCHFPVHWISSITSWEPISNGPWGVCHEMNHHHQGNWAVTGGTDEMSNNILNLIIFAQTSISSVKRTAAGDTGDWGKYTSPFQMLTDPDIEYGLSFYSNMIQFFGTKKVRQFIRADQSNEDKLRETWGRRAAELYRASKYLGKNMRYHCNYHGYSDEIIEDGKPEFWSNLSALHLPDFHPVTNAYSCGFFDEQNKRIETARPFQIPPYPCDIDFFGTMRQREPKNLWGDFELRDIHFEEGRIGAWKQISKGKYTLTPKPNIVDIEEVIVDYYDKSTNKITKVICKFQQTNNYARYKRYTNLGKFSIFDAYTKIHDKNLKPIEEEIVTNIYSKTIPDDLSGWCTLNWGLLTPPQSKTYRFSLIADDCGLFYLSENPLTGNATLDEPYLLNYQPTYSWGYSDSNISSPIFLDASKIYYFAMVIYNSPGTQANSGNGRLGYDTETTSKYLNVPTSWLRYKNVNETDIWYHQFEPQFDRMYELDKWQGNDFITENVSKFYIYKSPIGDCFYNSHINEGKKDPTMDISTCLTDYNPYTEFRTKWWVGDRPIQEFPHIYEIDMSENRSFTDLKIGGSANTNFFDMDSEIEVSLAPYNYTVNKDTVYNPNNYSIDHSESLIYSGRYVTTSPFVTFDDLKTGRYIRIKILNNRKMWKDKNDGRSSISTIEIGKAIHNQKVFPITNTKMLQFDSKWPIVTGGDYYNGKAMKGTKGNYMKVCIPKGKKEIGIIGDYFPGMGKAIVDLDFKEIGKIGESFQNFTDKKVLTMSTRSHKSILFYSKVDSSKNHVLRVRITEGEVTLTGILAEGKIVVRSTDDGSIDTDYDNCNFGSDDPINDNDNEKGKNGKLSVGAIAGIAVGAIVVIGAIIIIIVVIKLKKNGPAKSDNDLHDAETNLEGDGGSFQI